MAKKRICIYIDSDLHDSLKNLAEQEERTIVYEYEKAIKKFLLEKEK